MQRLETAIRLFDALLGRNRALRQEMAMLAEALTTASPLPITTDTACRSGGDEFVVLLTPRKPRWSRKLAGV